jgi:hypothetical protein
MHAYERAVLFVPHGWNTAVGLAADLQLVAAVPGTPCLPAMPAMPAMLCRV